MTHSLYWKHPNPVDLMGDLYSIASDIQDIGIQYIIFDLFTTDEPVRFMGSFQSQMLHSTC